MCLTKMKRLAFNSCSAVSFLVLCIPISPRFYANYVVLKVFLDLYHANRSH